MTVPGRTNGTNRLLTLAMICMLLAELIHLASDWRIAGGASQIGFCAMCLIGLRRASIREWALLAMATGFALFALLGGGGLQKLTNALQLGAFFGSFIILLTMLKEAAERSSSVLAVGHYLTSQPPGRRFYATAFGGHVLGVFLNFGTISLMAPLIQKSATTHDGTPSPQLEQRQLSALLRGFSWILLWAPTTLSQAILFTIFTDVSLSDIIWYGLISASIMIAIGRAYDWFEWRQRPLPASGHPRSFPSAAFGITAGICISLIAATFFLRGVTGFSIAASLMFMAPFTTVAWYSLQSPMANSWAGIQRKSGDFAAIFQTASPSLAKSAIALGLSGIIGRLAATTLPISQFTDLVDISAMPGWQFLAILPVMITLGGQIALSPILIVVFLGEIITSLPDLPVTSAQVVFALSAGWALSMTLAPNATATLLIAATSNIPPTTLTWRWNLRYGLICYIAFVAIFYLIT